MKYLIAAIGCILLGLTIMTVSLNAIYERTHKTHSEIETVNIRDINFLLNKEGYKIYFRITEEGQLSLVHPR